MTSTMDRARPATVTAAVALMMITALGYLITGFALFGQVGRTRAWARDEFQEFGQDEFMPSLAGSSVVIVAVMTIVAALLLLGAAVAVRSGSQAGRIVAWAVMGLLLLCGTSAITRGGTPDFGGQHGVLDVTLGRDRHADDLARLAAGLLPCGVPDRERDLRGPGDGRADRRDRAAHPALGLAAGSGRSRSPGRSPGRAGYHPVTQPRQQGMFGGPPPGPFTAPPPAGPPPVVGPTGPPWSRPVDGSAPRPSDAVDAELAVLARRHQRGEITDAEYAAARARLTGA
nr:hypothetical protein GCM10020092_089520 [Actinoplanes digitatis]